MFWAFFIALCLSNEANQIPQVQVPKCPGLQVSKSPPKQVVTFPRKWLKYKKTHMPNGNTIFICYFLLMLIGLTAVISCCGRQRRIWVSVLVNINDVRSNGNWNPQHVLRDRSWSRTGCMYRPYTERSRDGRGSRYGRNRGSRETRGRGQKPNKFKTAIGQIGWWLSVSHLVTRRRRRSQSRIWTWKQQQCQRFKTLWRSSLSYSRCWSI